MRRKTQLVKGDILLLSSGQRVKMTTDARIGECVVARTPEDGRVIEAYLGDGLQVLSHVCPGCKRERVPGAKGKCSSCKEIL